MIIHGNCIEKMKELEPNSVDAIVTDLQVGDAGEHIVCADLILKGHNTFQAAQGLPFDVVSMVGGEMIRIQVKTTRKPRPIPQRKKYTPAYLFHTRRCGKNGRRSYDSKDFDVLALVALDIRTVAYLTLEDTKQTIHLDINRFNNLTFERVCQKLN